MHILERKVTSYEIWHASVGQIGWCKGWSTDDTIVKLPVARNINMLTLIQHILKYFDAYVHGVKHSEIALRCGYRRDGIHGIELGASFVWMEEVVCGRYGWWEWWHRLSLGSRCTNPPPTPRLTSAREGSLSPALQHPGSTALVYLYKHLPNVWGLIPKRYEGSLNLVNSFGNNKVANNWFMEHFNN